MNCDDARAALHGYLDGELDPSLSLQYEQHMRDCPCCGKALAEQRTIRAALHTESLYYKAPARLGQRLRTALPGRRRAGRRWRWAAAAACLALCVGLGYLAARFTAAPAAHDRLADEVAAAHIRSLQAEHLVDVRSSDRHQVKPWFNGKLDFAPRVPDLAAIGFPLVGGRLDYLDGRPVAALVYRRRDHLINVFVWPDPAAASRAAPRAVHRDDRQGYHLLSWSGSGMDYWVVADLDPGELGELVRRLQE